MFASFFLFESVHSPARTESLVSEKSNVAYVVTWWYICCWCVWHVEPSRLLSPCDDAWISVWTCFTDDQRHWRWHGQCSSDWASSRVQVCYSLFIS